jgi:hypothetical protein
MIVLLRKLLKRFVSETLVLDRFQLLVQVTWYLILSAYEVIRYHLLLQ